MIRKRLRRGMIKMYSLELAIKNFRAIKNASLECAPLTVVYGANGSGKSSLIYALLTLKNIVLNPNQGTDSFFNYQFANIGGYEAVVCDRNPRKVLVTTDVRLKDKLSGFGAIRRCNQK